MQASKTNSSNNFTFSRYDLFSSFNTYNTLGLHLPRGLQRKSPLGIPQNSRLRARDREGRRRAARNLKFSFSSPSEWAEFAQDIENLPDFLATNQLILKSVFFSEQRQKC